MPGPTTNPFGIEAYKTIAYEVVEQLGRVPDAVVFPCARGNGLYGAWKGFEELREFGVIKKSPRMFACQPSAAPSLVSAFESELESPATVKPQHTIADAICENLSSQQALDAIRRSHGAAVGVEEDEIMSAMFQLGEEAVVTSSGYKSSLPICDRILGKWRQDAEADF